MSERQTKPDLVEAIDAWLPQTQCTQCGYPRCLDYARAIANGEADINQCPPGGDTTIAGLAGILGRPVTPLNTDYGEHRAKTLATIDEPRCIGCTLCIQACPVDAIVGAAKQMHTVIAAECTGCELCLPVCPVDCIELTPAPAPAPDASPWPEYSLAETRRARRRSRARVERLSRREHSRRLDKLHQRARTGAGRHRLKDDIAAAVSRVQARRRQNRQTNHEP